MDALISTAVGAFFGTLAAFGAQWLKQQRDETISEVALGNKILLSMADVLQELYRVHGQYLLPIRNRSDRHLRLYRYIQAPDEPAVDLADFVYLTKEPNPLPGLVSEVLNAMKAAKAARSQLVIRDDFRLELVRQHESQLLSAGMKSADQVVRVFGEVIGPLKDAMLKSHTDNVYYSTEEAISLMSAAIINFRSVHRVRYPSFEFIEIRLDKREGGLES